MNWTRSDWIHWDQDGFWRTSRVQQNQLWSCKHLEEQQKIQMCISGGTNQEQGVTRWTGTRTASWYQETQTSGLWRRKCSVLHFLQNHSCRWTRPVPEEQNQQGPSGKSCCWRFWFSSSSHGGHDEAGHG